MYLAGSIGCTIQYLYACLSDYAKEIQKNNSSADEYIMTDQQEEDDTYVY